MQNAEKQANLPLDAKEAARLLKMDSRTLVCWARRGYVPAHPLGEGKRFFESELLEWVENHENGCVRKPPESTLKAAIDAHAERIA
jgi:excisionase family DNA binding protein